MTRVALYGRVLAAESVVVAVKDYRTTLTPGTSLVPANTLHNYHECPRRGYSGAARREPRGTLHPATVRQLTTTTPPETVRHSHRTNERRRPRSFPIRTASTLYLSVPVRNCRGFTRPSVFSPFAQPEPTPDVHSAKHSPNRSTSNTATMSSEYIRRPEFLPAALPASRLCQCIFRRPPLGPVFAPLRPPHPWSRATFFEMRWPAGAASADRGPAALCSRALHALSDFSALSQARVITG